VTSALCVRGFLRLPFEAGARVPWRSLAPLYILRASQRAHIRSGRCVTYARLMAMAAHICQLGHVYTASALPWAPNTFGGANAFVCFHNLSMIVNGTGVLKSDTRAGQGHSTFLSKTRRGRSGTTVPTLVGTSLSLEHTTKHIESGGRRGGRGTFKSIPSSS
jgi:hypothetical protein